MVFWVPRRYETWYTIRMEQVPQVHMGLEDISTKAMNAKLCIYLVFVNRPKTLFL